VFRHKGTWRPRALFTYKRELQEDGADAPMQFVNEPASSFATSGLPIGKSTITGLLGLTALTPSGLEYGVRYEFRRATGEMRQKLVFRIRFR
jgi:hypothetical protein